MPSRFDRILPPDSVWRRLLGNAGWLLGARAANLPLALLETVLLARLLGPDGYGTVGVVMATVVVLQRIFSFRMNEFVVKFVTDALERGQSRKAAATLKLALLAEAASSLIACLVVMLTATFLATHFLEAGEGAEYFRLFALWALANGVIESTTAALQVFDRFKFLAGNNVFRKLVLVSAIGAIYLANGGTGEVLLAYLAANLTANIVTLVEVSRLARTRLGASWWRTPIVEVRARWNEMGRFAIATNLGATLSVAARDADPLWLGFFRASSEVGFFKLAGSLLKAPFAAGSPVTKAFYPEVTRIVSRGHRDRLGRFLRRITLVSAAWVIPLSVITALAAPVLVRWLYGNEFLPVVPALRILLVGVALSYILFWTRPTLLALGRPGLLLKITTLGAVLKIVFALLIVPSYGYLGLATLLVSIQVLAFALHLLAIGRTLDVVQSTE